MQRKINIYIAYQEIARRLRAITINFYEFLCIICRVLTNSTNATGRIFFDSIHKICRVKLDFKCYVL